MNKILLIIQREYFSRVKKKSFITMTILGPLLMAGLFLTSVYFAVKEKSAQKIMVIDDTIISEQTPIPSTENLKFEVRDMSLGQAQKELYKSDFTAILYIPENVATGGKAVNIFYKKPVGLHAETHIKAWIEQVLVDQMLLANDIDKKIIDNAQKTSRVKVLTKKQLEFGESEETSTGLNMAIGFGAGILIYVFIFLYGVQVMRGVIEEKTNRIVEVIISSVKPFQLMMGKIIGIAFVGLTQFLLWIVLTLMLVTVGQATILKDITKEMQVHELKQEEVMKKGADINALKAAQSDPMQNFHQFKEVQKAIEQYDFMEIILCFIFYFLGGYLLYSALFAAVGAAVDNEADTQQFMLPLTMPLVLAFIVAQFIMQDPESPIAFWFSMIPFTSPVTMMVRLPFGVEPWEVWLSMGLLILGFLFTTWLAGRIYRTGILMYGKRVSYRELWKWLFYRG